MGKIKNTSKYPLKNNPTTSDYFVGTDYESGETINFPVGSIIGETSTVIHDNKFIEVNYGKVVGDGVSDPDIASAINAIPTPIEILYDEIPYFGGVVYDGVGRSYYNIYVIISKGKGIYGVGGNITVTNAELTLISSFLLNSLSDLDRDPNAVVTDLGDITGATVLDTINAATPFVIAADENRYWNYLDGGLAYIYGFSGAAGTYGSGQTPILITELFLVDDSAEIIVTKTSELINDGSDATSTYVETDELGAAAFDNLYSSLTGLPTIPAAVILTSELINDGSDATSTYVETDELGAAAFSNNYSDLTGIPTFGGLDNQIPFVNATNDGFEYSSNFIYNGSKLHLLNVANTIEIGNYVGNVEGVQLSKNSLTFVDGNTVADIIISSTGFKVDRFDTAIGTWYKNDSIVIHNAARTFEQSLVPASIIANHILTIPNATDTLAVRSDIKFQNLIDTDGAVGYTSGNSQINFYEDAVEIQIADAVTAAKQTKISMTDSNFVLANYATVDEYSQIEIGETSLTLLRQASATLKTTVGFITPTAIATINFPAKSAGTYTVALVEDKLHGIFDYNDLATTTTPIVITGGGGFVNLTNDELGAFTNKLYPPTGVTDVWDASTNAFDFSELGLGSAIHIRFDIDVITTSVNQEVEINLDLGIGSVAPYTLFIDREEFKVAATYNISKTFFIYMGDTNTQNFPAKLKLKSDGNATVVVNGWACNINLY